MKVTDREYALNLDSKDPLAKYKNEFVISDPDLCYLDGNSLGRLPKKTIEVVNNYLTQEWGPRIVEGWAEWIDEAESVGDLIGRAALGSAAGQVLACDTTSVNFYQLVGAALAARPGRKTIIIDKAKFPTERYILQGFAERHGIKALTELAREYGALAIWDASHAVGAIDMKLDESGVDLVVGCTYKYGNSGPGSPAWMYVSKRVQGELKTPIQGWFAQRNQFAMGPVFEKNDGMRGFQIASPSLIGLRCIQSAFGMIEEASIEEIDRKCAIGTQMMIELFDEWLAPLGFTMNTSRLAHERGGHISLVHPDAKRISIALREFANVIPDYREPNSIRVAISPLPTSYVEIWDGFARLRDLVTTRQYEKINAENIKVT